MKNRNELNGADVKKKFYEVRLSILLPLAAFFMMGADDCMDMPASGTIAGITQCVNSTCSSHQGYDITPDQPRSPVFAMGDGQIIQTRTSSSGHGNRIVLRTYDGFHIYYAHLSSFSVSNGQHVSRGQMIGRTGKSGAANGVDHLHFEIWDVLWQRHENQGAPHRIRWPDGRLTPFRTAPNGERIRMINANETGLKYLDRVEAKSVFQFDRDLTNN